MKILKNAIIFDWDRGNTGKNFIKHKVKDEECEEVFFDPRKKLLKDTLHSKKEVRYIILGKTKKQRLLFIVFAIREEKIRVISARDVNQKERSFYR